MSERLKMVLKLLGLLAVTALIAFGLYEIFFGGGPNIPGTSPEPGGTTTGGLPVAGEGQPGSGTTAPGEETPGSGHLAGSPVANGGLTQTTLLTTAGVKQPTITAAGTVAYYDPQDGRFYTIDEKGNVELLSPPSPKRAP
jgi:hypothetical protein